LNGHQFEEAGMNMGVNIKVMVPWQAKIAAKLILARLPFKYDFWRKLNLFKHGSMARPEYAFSVFKKHFGSVAFARQRGGFTALELGAGDSLFSAIIARAYGAKLSYLIDAGNFAIDDPELYRQMSYFLAKEGMPVPDLSHVRSIAEVLHACNAQYETGGLVSLKKIPDKSVDFIWSNAVLEHVRKSEFLATSYELRRILRDDGVCAHTIDFKDHLGGALNNLRFPTRVWESDFMARSGFYTNRIGYAKMLDIFKKVGFDVNIIQVKRWDCLPTPRSRLAKEFRNISEEHLLVQGAQVVLKPR
jgi:SAM-dependent methyltransferase